MSHKIRIKKLEKKTDQFVYKTCCFIGVGRYDFKPDGRRIFCEKNGLKYPVVIWEQCGKEFSRVIPSESEEGQRILFEGGYRICS